MTPGAVQVSCSRCFKVFEAPEGRAGAVPLCADCAARQPAASRRAPARPVAPAGRARRRAIGAGLVAALVIAGAVGGIAWTRARRPSLAAQAPRAQEIQDRLQAWRAAGLVPAAVPGDPRRFAEARARDGREALRADLPPRTREALAAFRQALAADPGEVTAAAGFAEAVADAADADADPDAEDLRAAHLFLDAVEEGAPRGAPPRAAVAAARARLLLLVDSAGNAADARRAASAAIAAAPGDAAAALALGLATGRGDAARAAALLLEAYRKDPGDRRLLGAAARARRAAGDDAGALALAAERAALDPGHPGALALEAEIREAAGQAREARAALERWRAAAPDAWLPPLLLARRAWQVEGQLPAARALLAEALPRAPGPFAASRVLALRAAVERLLGDEAAARASAAEAVARVPGAAPARFQAALLAWRAGDARVLRESAGVLNGRAGPVEEALLALRVAELGGTSLEAFDAWKAAGGIEAADPRALLAAAATLHRGLAAGPALEVARAFLERDPVEVRLERVPSDFDEGPLPAAEACALLEASGRAEHTRGARALAAAAACELAFGHTVRADALARAAAALTPQAAAPQWIRAQLLLDRGAARAALPLAAGAVGDDPRSGVAREVLARVLEALGRAEEAARARASPAAQKAALVTTRLARARALAREGRAAEARALARALAAERPELVAPRALLLELATR